MSVFGRKNKKSKLTLTSPLNGKIVSLNDVPDETFASKVLGEGVAIVPSSGVLVASENGHVMSVADTKHAIVLKYNNGIEVLMHIGIDTVELGGDGFNPYVTAGHIVEKGTVLIEFDIDKIKSRGYNVITPIIVTNSDEYCKFSEACGEIKTGQKLIEIEK